MVQHIVPQVNLLTGKRLFFHKTGMFLPFSLHVDSVEA